MTDRPGFDAILEELEAAIARLADSRAPLEEVVVTYERARLLAAQAQRRLEALTELAKTHPPGHGNGPAEAAGPLGRR